MQVFSASPVAVYSGVGNAFSRISSTEGIRTLWRGVSSVVLGAGPAHAVHFGTLEAVKELAGGNRGGPQWLATCEFVLEILPIQPCLRTPALAGASATIAADALMNPFDGACNILTSINFITHKRVHTFTYSHQAADAGA
jgi:hypothetical protein